MFMIACNCLFFTHTDANKKNEAVGRQATQASRKNGAEFTCREEQSCTVEGWEIVAW